MDKTKHWNPIPQLNNYTISELKEILFHCEALEQLGVAQNPQLIQSIKREIANRHKENEERKPETEQAVIMNVCI